MCQCLDRRKQPVPERQTFVFRATNMRCIEGGERYTGRFILQAQQTPLYVCLVMNCRDGRNAVCGFFMAQKPDIATTCVAGAIKKKYG